MRIAFRIIFVVIISVGACLAQPNPPGKPGGGGNPSVPISGIEWLLVAGGLLGARKVINFFGDRNSRNV